MVYKKIDYQDEAVENLIIETERLLAKGKQSPVIAFKAPTGSGKTIITARYIQNVCNRLDDDFCFIWISVGKGELHIQSRNKLNKIFQGNPKASLLIEEFFGYRDIINKNEVVVVNWESINNKDRDGNHTNKFMKDGEKINFRQVLKNTRAIGRKIILIIDESHYSATTDRAKELRDEINSNIILEMSATPKLVPNRQEEAEGKGAFVWVDIDRVIEEEMIKKEVIINEGFEESDQSTTDDKLLNLAFEKRLVLKQALDDEDSKVNPLVIVQLPNAEEGENKKNKVVEFLKLKDITVDNGKLAIWLNEEKENLANISDNTSTVEFLIFKQAIDTGWDCPRAHILLRFRETQSFIFEKQTLGRILRMPEQSYYTNDNLNKAYIYTDYTGNVLKVIDEEFDFPRDNFKNQTVYQKDEYGLVPLVKQFKQTTKKSLRGTLAQNIFNTIVQEYGLENAKFEKNKEILTSKGFVFDTSKLTENIIGDIEIESEELLGDKEDFEGKEVIVELDEERTEVIFRRILRKRSTALGNSRDVMFEILRERIYEFFFNFVVDFTKEENFMIKIQKMFILNYNYYNNNFFSKLIDDVIERYKGLKEEELKEIHKCNKYDYKIPTSINVNTDNYDLVAIDKYYYKQCYLQKDRSKPEKDFEEFIKSNLEKIEFWLKNGDRGSEYFCMVYELYNEKHEFYPDYIVKFLDSRIGIFEAKSKDDNSDETKQKAERLYKYIEEENQKGKNILGGIVANYGTDSIYIKIHNKDTYSTNFTEWLDLHDLI